MPSDSKTIHHTMSMLRRTPIAALSIAALAIAALALPPATAAAQRADALRVGAVPALHAADSAPPRARRRDAEALRVVTGMAGWAAGAYAGGTIGYHLRASRGGEWDGVEEAILGAWVGGLAGAALGSAFPDLGHPCDDRRRLGRAFAGSTVGSVVGLAGFAAGPWVIITVPVGSLIGSVAGASGCRPAPAR
jgi:hypothetical protein